MNTKKSTDIYFSAALLALGAKLEDVDKTDPRHMEFTFIETELFNSKILSNAVGTLDSAETQWANKTLMVNAFDFAEGLKRLKSVVHSH